MKFLHKLSKQNQVFLAVVIAIAIGIPVLGLLKSVATINSTQTSFAPSRTSGETSGSAAAPMMQKIAPDDGFDMMAESNAIMYDDRMGIMPPTPVEEGFTPDVDRTIVKNANISMVVDDTRQVIDEITAVTNQAEGTVTDSSINEGQAQSGIVYANMTLRVPVEKVETVLASIRQLGIRVTSENTSAQDRTEQKIDLEAQLTNLKATEAQFQTILTQARTVEETLNVQKELSTVRGQIERLEARLENLLGDAAMSVIYVSLSTEEAELPLVDPSNRSVFQEIRIAFRDAVTLYRVLFISGLRLTILASPILVIGIISFVIWRKRK